MPAPAGRCTLRSSLRAPRSTPVWSDPAYRRIHRQPAGRQRFYAQGHQFLGRLSESNVPVGPLTGDLTQDILLEPDLLACTAPGYMMHGIMQGFDSTSLPAGWTVSTSAAPAIGRFNNPGGRGNLTGGTGNFAIADSDECGSGTTMSSILYFAQGGRLHPEHDHALVQVRLQ